MAMQRELTGKHVLIIMLVAFGTIIAANVVMMASAIRTFPGLVVDNSYVASQEFDKKRAAQEALGWTTAVIYRDGECALNFTNKDGAPVYPEDVTAKIGRSTTTRDDLAPELVMKGAGFAAPLKLDNGKWVVDIEAVAADGTIFSQSHSLYVKDGQMIE